MKVVTVYVVLCSFTQAVYISRMTPISRMTTINRVRSPTAFRPGVSLQSIHTMQRPWPYGSMRLASAASQRTPYVVYRSPPQRYAIKHYAPSATRNLFAQIPWKTTLRLPPMSPVTPEYEFIKAASAQPVMQTDGGTGAIHTIPAPNLSLSEKPIVVIDSSEKPALNQPKPSYEVTEKYPEGEFNIAKIESPIGFSKATSFTTPELQTLIRNGAALQLASEYSLPAISHHEILPQQFQMQTIASFPSHRDLVNTGAEGIFIPPNALYQSDPMFLQKLQSQLMQRYPAVEFIPYAAGTPNQVHLPPQPQASHHHPQIVLLENEQINDKPQTTNVPEQNEQKNVVQRDTQETSVATLIPHSFVAPNTTEMQVSSTTTSPPQNITLELVAAESHPVTTTIKYVIEGNPEKQNATPIYYAQVGQSIGSVIADGFYSAINDVRAAAALAQVEEKTEKVSERSDQDVTTTTSSSELINLTYITKSDEKTANVTNGMKPLLGAPFTKATDALNVSYTLVRDDKQPKVTQERTIYAGQIVEATISEDHDFNKEKATLMARRAPIRLTAVENLKNTPSTPKTAPEPKQAVVKAKISPNTKLTFDDKTGEPILRIYASYQDNTSQKDAMISKLSSLKPINENEIRKDLVESWRGGTVKSAGKTHDIDVNQVTQFGLKIRERSDDYIPLFEDYDD